MKGSHNGILGEGSYITFSHLSVHDNPHEGIYWEGDNTVVEYSTIYNNRSGINFWDAHTSGGPTGHNIARYNTIHDNKIYSGTQRGDGITVATNLPGGTGADLYNNVIYDNDVGVFLTYNFSYGTISNNTIYGNTNVFGDGVGIYITQFASNAVIANNQVYGNQMTDILDDGYNTTRINN